MVVSRKVSLLRWMMSSIAGKNIRMVRLYTLFQSACVHSWIGCNELIFNPLIHWWRLGPINHQLASFMWSPVPVHYKVGMMAYMFSYYGIAAGAALSVLNYILLGFEFGVDGFFMHSFEIWLACTVVFPGAGNVAFTLLQYRLGLRSIWSGAKENLTWVPFL